MLSLCVQFFVQMSLKYRPPVAATLLIFVGIAANRLLLLESWLEFLLKMATTVTFIVIYNTTGVSEFIHKAFDNSCKWIVSSWKLFLKSELGMNHRIGSKVKFNDFGPILCRNVFHFDFKQI